MRSGKTNIRLCTLILILMVFLSSCKKNPQLSEPISGNLAGRNWQLVQIDTVNGASLILDPADTIILTFDDQHRLSGKSPGRCGNTYFGVYSIPTENAIRIDSLITTEIYCRSSQYQYFYGLLANAEQYQLYEARLDLLCNAQTRWLVFRPIH